MLESLAGNKFEYKHLSEEEQRARGILGRLVGPCADFIHKTRNDRKYSEELWENVFNNPIMKEKIANRCCFGELNHPSDRTEVDIKNVAICLAELPKKGKDGKLYSVFDILNTPNGRILKALCDYGCKIGISSRGQGDITGDEVDPDTYECECFDAVLIPGVEAARLNYVNESLDTSYIKLKKELKESFDKASDDEKEIMKATLENLNIEITEEAKKDDNEDKVDSDDLDQKEESEPETNESGVEDTDDEVSSVSDNSEIDADDTNSSGEEISDIIDIDNTESESESEESELDLFIRLLNKFVPEDKVKDIAKILDIDVSDEAEVDSEEDAAEDSNDDIDADIEVTSGDEPDETDNKDESTEPEDAVDDGDEDFVESLREAMKDNAELQESIKDLQEKLAVSDSKVSDLQEECNRYKLSMTRLAKIAKNSKKLDSDKSKLEESLKEKDEIIESQKARIINLAKNNKKNAQNSDVLNESLTSKNSEIKSLNENLKKVTEEYESKITALNEQISSRELEYTEKLNKLTESVTKESAIKESYRKLANKAVNKYIDIKADMIGLTPSDIKRKLGNTYTMDDVDAVCESLKSYQLNVSKLPFSVDKKISVKVNESVNTKSLSNKSKYYDDDDVDDGLIRLANNLH